MTPKQIAQKARANSQKKETFNERKQRADSFIKEKIKRSWSWAEVENGLMRKGFAASEVTLFVNSIKEARREAGLKWFS